MKVLLFWLSGLVAAALGDYTCICNYDVEHGVLAAPKDGAATLGYLYEFDCKEQIQDEKLGEGSWYVLAFNHQRGYVKKADSIQLSICTGDPSSEDRREYTNVAANHGSKLIVAQRWIVCEQ